MGSRIGEAARFIRTRYAGEPRIGIVLGTGLGALAQGVSGVTILYSDIPNFPVSTVGGHAGQLVLGQLSGHSVAVLSGRVHLYEGYSAQEVVFPVLTLRALGVQTLILTNAAGGVNSSFQAGTLMAISDHINLTGHNPLVGPNDPSLGERFPDMTQAYDGRLREVAHRAAEQTRVELPEGVYMGLLGPSFETPAEIGMARALGADAVGMSTVMETIAANHAGMRVLGISCITNMAAGMLPQKLSGHEVFETACRVQPRFTALMRSILEVLSTEY